MNGAGELTLAQVAARAGVSPATVTRWVSRGLVPGFDGRWTPACVAYVRVVARLRARGHSLEQIKRASDRGQLAVGPIENLLSTSEERYTLQEAASATGLEEELVERIFTTLGLGSIAAHALSDEDVEMLKYVAAVLDAGIPLEAYLQLSRVYGQALAQIADAEVRLFHLYVHEPLMRQGMPGLEIAEQMEGLVGEVLPFIAPLLAFVHGRFLAHFVEQDVIGHMESDLDEASDEGRLRVAIAFADLAGYARLTVERGDEAAVGAVERFVEAVELSLPPDARVTKTLGDEVMVVGSDPAALTEWAVGLQAETAGDQDASVRIGIHYGDALYRDGDYYGREVNQAARVVARAGGGEVLVTRPVVEMASGVDGLEFDRIGEVRLKGFSEPTELFIAYTRGE
jgi:adenylate cyclase